MHNHLYNSIMHLNRGNKIKLGLASAKFICFLRTYNYIVQDAHIVCFKSFVYTHNAKWIEELMANAMV